jgi:hypothetical protein
MNPGREADLRPKGENNSVMMIPLALLISQQHVYARVWARARGHARRKHRQAHDIITTSIDVTGTRN